MLEVELPRAGRAALQELVPESWVLHNSVKALAPSNLHGATDGDRVKNFVDTLDTCFASVGIRDQVQKA